MTRRTLTSLAVAVTVLAASLVAASTLRAAPAGAVCPAFSKHGLKYQWETVGTGFTCKSAKRWLLKLIKDRVPATGGEVALHNGPNGYHCYATLVTKHLASGGLCYKGTLAYPKSGFTWNGS
jgi:hypothetical protein